MIFKLLNINDLEKIVNEVEKFDSVTLFKSVKAKNGFVHKIRMGEYVMFDGDNSCELICDKSLISLYCNIMKEKGYTLVKERGGMKR